MPVCLAAGKSVAKGTPKVPSAIGKARGRSGELGTLGARGRTFTACTRVFPAPRTRSMRRYLGYSWNFLVGMTLGQKQGSRIFFANRELVISTSATRQECKNQRKDLMGTVKVFKRALVPIRHHTRNWDQLELGWSRHHFLVHGRSTMSNPWLQGAAKWSQTTAQWMES